MSNPLPGISFSNSYNQDSTSTKASKQPSSGYEGTVSSDSLVANVEKIKQVKPSYEVWPNHFSYFYFNEVPSPKILEEMSISVLEHQRQRNQEKIESKELSELDIIYKYLENKDSLSPEECQRTEAFLAYFDSIFSPSEFKKVGKQEDNLPAIVSEEEEEELLPTNPEQEHPSAHKIAQVLADLTQTIKEKKKTEKPVSRNYAIHPIDKDKILGTTNQQIDSMEMVEDFIHKKTLPEVMGYSHMWRRLNAFHVLAKYIEKNALAFQQDGITFPFNEKDQYHAMAHFVPEVFDRNRKKDPTPYKNSERAHCSEISKISVKKDGMVGRLKGLMKIKYKNEIKEVSLEHFFNLCDVAPTVLNIIDWCFEYLSRAQLMNMLNLIKNKHLTAMEALTQYVNNYKNLYTHLIKILATPPNKYPSKEFKENVEYIRDHEKKALPMTQGIKQAIEDYTKEVEKYSKQANSSDIPELFIEPKRKA